MSYSEPALDLKEATLNFNLLWKYVYINTNYTIERPLMAVSLLWPHPYNEIYSTIIFVPTMHQSYTIYVYNLLLFQLVNSWHLGKHES